jgi:hypothetical protein
MTEPLSRDDVIGLLKRLGSDRDEEVLEAAREVHARVTAAGTSWDELLRPDEAATGEAEGAEAAELAEEAAAPGAEAPVAPGTRDAESLALIDKLLARSDISGDLREELEGYKADIAAGEFEDRDHRYLRAVHQRLSKRR